jgi:hypothetical protein
VEVLPEGLPLLAEEAGEREGLAVRGERGGGARAVPADEPGDGPSPGGDEAEVEVVQVGLRVLHPVRAEGDRPPVGGEHGLHVVRVPVRELRHLSRLRVHQVEVGVGIEQEPQPVLLEVDGTVDLELGALVLRVVLLGLAPRLLLLAQGAMGNHEALPVRRPFHGRDGAVHVGEPARLPALHGQQVHLLLLVVPVRDEGQGVAVRRPSGKGIAVVPVGEGPRLAPPRGHQIQVRRVLVVLEARRGQGIHDPLAVRGHPGPAHEGEPEEVVCTQGGERLRHDSSLEA